MTYGADLAAPTNPNADENSVYRYIPPFQLIREAMQLHPDALREGKRVTITAEFFKFLIGIAIAQAYFDERWYLETYPDVEAAISRGTVTSALNHYVTAGYYEGRSAGPCHVDCAWYEQYYSDVAAALRNGTIVDSADHFQHNGYFEGRAPTPEQLHSLDQWRRALGLT